MVCECLCIICKSVMQLLDGQAGSPLRLNAVCEARRFRNAEGHRADSQCRFPH